MKATLKYLKPYSGTAAAALTLKVVGSAAELFLPLILDYIIDNVVPEKDVKLMIILGAAMLGFSIVALLGNIFANRLAAKAAGGMTHDLRYDLFKKTTYLQCSQVDAFTSPSLVSRLTSDTYYVNNTVAQSLRMGVRAPILLVGGLVFTFIIDWRLALVLAACVPFVAIAVALIAGKSVKMYAVVQRGGDDVVRTMQENISGVRVIKALSKTEYEVEKFRTVNANLTANEFATNKITSLTNPIATLILNIGLVGVIAAGAALSASTGTVLAFLTYFTLILNAMLGISKIFVNLSRGVASAARIEKVMEVNEKMPVGVREESGNDYALEFSDVSFSYNGKRNNLEGISFGVKEGQTVGIIGGTGSGKSTLINLLMRFYDVGGGAVYVDGKDVRTYEESELHAKFGAVFQSDFLISSSIFDNVDFFRSLPEEDIDKAVECSCAKEFIDGLEGGMDYVLAQKAANISGGQKQRLLIARALAGNPRILILDDSSSALDYATDARLRKGLSEGYSHCTKFIVAQRVSAVRHADLIIVLDDGRIVGKGTHDELYATCEDYRHICVAQMGGDI